MNLVFIFSDQLSYEMSSIQNCNKKEDIILFLEVEEEFVYIPHHKQKIIFIISSMRRFADNLSKDGYNIFYIKIDDPNNTHKIETEILRIFKIYQINKLLVTHPSEYRLLEKINFLSTKINVEIYEDNRFLCSIKDFKEYAKNKKQLRMEFFYRIMRKKYNILIEDNMPIGGKWNYDSENRGGFPETIKIVDRIRNKKNIEIINLVNKIFPNNFGNTDLYNLADNKDDAMKEAVYFVDNILPYFGKYQDIMMADDDYIYHSNLSTYINVGFIKPLELCSMVEKKYKDSNIPINAAEGYIRQILGWREYVRGIYWLYMPKYIEMNHFDAKRKLPWFYWSGETDMNCLMSCIKSTKNRAYSHHIQRLMITGNFALLAGISPKETHEWYLSVYSDAYEWVELPNTIGMALYADGGIMASKPYCASGKYIKKMSNFCVNCKYNPDTTTEQDSCPFNILYWNFLNNNKEKLKKNGRMGYVLYALDKFTSEKIKTIKSFADKILNKL